MIAKTGAGVAISFIGWGISQSLCSAEWLTEAWRSGCWGLAGGAIAASTSRIPSRVIVGRLGVTSEFDGRDFHPHQKDSSAL